MSLFILIIAFLVFFGILFSLAGRMISAGPFGRFLWAVLWGLLIAVFSSILSIKTNKDLDIRFTVKSLLNTHSEEAEKEKSSLEAAVKDRFYLIDVAESRKIFSDNNSGIPITSRLELAAMLNHLRRYEDCIEVIAIDLLLDDRTTEDDTLIKALDFWLRGPKLILAKSEDGTSIIKDDFGSFAYATHPSREKKFLNTILKSTEQKSFAYELYCRSEGIALAQSPFLPNFIGKESDGNNSPYFLNDFTPNLPVQNIAEIGKENTKLSYLTTNGVNTIPLSFFHENDLEIFDYSMESYREQGRKLIILVGHFTGSQDIHETINGNMYGTSIIVNIWHQLVIGKHRQFLYSILEAVLVAAILIYLKLSHVRYKRRRANNGKAGKSKILYLLSYLIGQAETLIYLFIGFLLAYFFRNIFVDLQDVVILLVVLTVAFKTISFREGWDDLSMNEGK